MKFRRQRNDDPKGPRRGWDRRQDQRVDPTHQPDLEPAHDQPWVPRSSFTARVRRSPHQ